VYKFLIESIYFDFLITTLCGMKNIFQKKFYM